MPETKKEKREQLLKLFKAIPMEPIPTEGAICDVSRCDLAKIINEDGKLYDDVPKKLQELDRKRA